MLHRSFCSSLAAAGLLTATAFAGSPRLSQTYPAAGQRGTEIEVTCSGSNLADAKGFLFDEPGFEATVVSAVAGNFKAKIKVPANARLGEHQFRAITASGMTDVRLFYVTPFPMTEEVEKKDQPNAAQPVALGSTVYGRTPADDQDRYEVEMKKGQRLTVEAVGMRVQTQNIYDPHILISKPDGSELASADDTAFSRQDPVTSVIAPEDGKYVITIRDSTNAGDGACQYQMNIGSFPRPLAVYPAGGPAGEELKVKLIGDASGPMERTVKLPAQAQDRFELFSEQEQLTPQPNVLRVSYFPNALEAEPNNDVPTAQKLTEETPFAINGIIGEKGDNDCFKFTAKKGADYEIRVFGRTLRSPLDPVLTIYNDKGAQLATNDDSGNPDSYLRWKAPADGEFILHVRDQLFRGGPTFVYRVELTPIQPRLTAWLPEMTINQNQDRRAMVVAKGNRYASLLRIKRWDVGGDVQVEPTDLPPGIQVTAPRIDKTVDTIPMVFEAAADAAPAAKVFGVTAKLTEPPKDTKVESGVEHLVDIAENGNQRPYYSIIESKLPVAITEEIPVKINLVAPKAPLLQGGSLGLKVVAERKNDFKGPITLSFLYSPPGVGNAGLLTMKEGETEATMTISANGNAAPQKWKVCIVGSADFGKGPVWFSTAIEEIEIAPPLVVGQIVRTFVDQGDSTNVRVKLEHKAPFEGKARLQLLGLPPNTTAETKEFTKEDKEVEFIVKADKAAPAGQHKQLFCQFSLEKDGDTMTSAFAQGGILRVDKATVAKNEEPKK
jgi:hypothetical protein